MGYYEYDTGYFEPSEFDEKCDELKEYLLDHARTELKDKISSLEKENARMSEIVRNYDKKVSELKEKERNFEFKEKCLRNELEAKIRRERLSKLMDSMIFHIWGIKNEGIKRPKCNKCDNDRYIHFKSPSGKDCKEPCSCSQKIPCYVISQEKLVELRLSKNNGEHFVGYFREKNYDDDDYYSETNAHYVEESMYKGQPYKTIKSYYGVYFKSEEEAQKYADWLNAKVKKEEENKNA